MTAYAIQNQKLFFQLNIKFISLIQCPLSYRQEKYFRNNYFQKIYQKKLKKILFAKNEISRKNLCSIMCRKIFCKKTKTKIYRLKHQDGTTSIDARTIVSMVDILFFQQ